MAEKKREVNLYPPSRSGIAYALPVKDYIEPKKDKKENKSNTSMSNRNKAMIDESKKLKDRKLTGADGSNYKKKADSIVDRQHLKGR